MSDPPHVNYPCASMKRVLVVAVALLLAGCGGSKKAADPAQSLPSENGIRTAVQQASKPRGGDFPSPQGKSLEQLANQLAAGPTLAMASSVFTVGPSRVAFGVIDNEGQPIYGATALYVAPTPQSPALGPYVAPADVLLTQARYRSRQAATASDPFVAVYGSRVPFTKTGKWAVLAATKEKGGGFIGSTANIDVSTKAADPIPAVGSKAPLVHTDTLASAKGDVTRIDTRVPPSDMHKEDFAAVVGKKPVALLFSTPQLCQSRVCGPVTDIALQMEAKYGDKMTFIHQEVYVDNDATKGLRPPLVQFHLSTEPWLFVVNRQGIITARLEGSIGVQEFEHAVQSGL
jgi:hypothetical protein